MNIRSWWVSYDVDAVISDNLYKVSNYLWEYDESRSRSAWFYKIAARCASSYMKSEYNWRYHHRDMATKSVNDDEIVELELADREVSRRDQPDFQIIVNEVMESVD